jgi:hypothetical protein
VSQRASGILLHLTSLPNEYPIGDLGPAATSFVDFMAKSGQHLWQMLPIGPLGAENSPYESSSAFAGNPFLMSPDRLVERGFLTRHEIGSLVTSVVGKVDYSAASVLKRRVLRKAFDHFSEMKTRWNSELNTFVEKESFWLEDFALFSAIQESEGTSDWTRWKIELRTRQPGGPCSRAAGSCGCHPLPPICPMAIFGAMGTIESLLRIQACPIDRRCSDVCVASKRGCLGSPRVVQIEFEWQSYGGRWRPSR